MHRSKEILSNAVAVSGGRDHPLCGFRYVGCSGIFRRAAERNALFLLGSSLARGDDLWIEKIFPVQPEEMEQYVIYAEFTDLVPEDEIENLLQYEWQVTFPGNMIQIETNK